ncbi:MAG TPA: Ig-like domain-containing protein [Gemmatimonadales bacterium]|nr:Ig-like domain-containing protein [Gemmatimonadales bacterium]
MISNAWRWGAGFISAGAGLVSILSYTHSIRAKFEGMDSVATEALAHAAVRWVGITPTADTATSIGDTIQLAVTATDARGNALLGAPTTWSSTDTAVASVDSAGTVVARGGGATAVTVMIGGKSALTHVYVQQAPADLRVVGESMFRVPEGERGKTVAQVVDARGHEIPGLGTRWRSADPSIVAIDSMGNATGIAPGRTSLVARYNTLVVQLPVEVYPVPASLTLLGGDGQRAPAGRRVSQPVMVQVVSRSGRPIEGVPVRFVLEEGAGRVEPAADSSDVQGMARAAWTLGGAPGRQSLSVVAEGVASPTLVTAEAEPVAANTRIAVVTEHLEGPAGGALPEPFAVRVTDSSGVALADVPVAWTAGDNGSIVANESRTDSLGEARARWTLGPESGSQRAYVQVGNARAMPRFMVEASALAGAPAGLALVNGKKSEGLVGAVLKPLPELRVVDRAGNPVPGVALTILPSSGTVTDSTPATDSTGRVRVAWTLGRNAGLQRMTARVEGVPRPVEISARARAAGPANLTFVAPKPGTANRAIQSLDVDLTDAYGNPVADQPVVFSTKVGNVSPGRVMTDAHGRAHTRWTPGTKVGQRTLLAAVKGTDARASFVLEAPIAAAPLKAATVKKQTVRHVAR